MAAKRIDVLIYSGITPNLYAWSVFSNHLRYWIDQHICATLHRNIPLTTFNELCCETGNRE